MKLSLKTLLAAGLVSVGVTACSTAATTGCECKSVCPKACAPGGVVKLVSHRGECVDAPEGSMPAYRFAAERKLDILKLDLQETKDGVIVLSHDPSLRRMMGWDVKIRRVTYAEIMEKGVYKTVGGVAGEKIVRLQDLLPMLKDFPEIWMDFKHFTPGFFDRVQAMLTAAGYAEERRMVATFTQSALEYAKEKYPKIRRVLHVSVAEAPGGGFTTSAKKGECADEEAVLAKIAERAAELGCFGLNMPQSCRKVVNAKGIKYLHDRNLWISVHFVNKRETADFNRAAGADAFVTDIKRETLP